MARPAKIATPEVLELAYILASRHTPQYSIRKTLTKFLGLKKPVNYRTFWRIMSRVSDKMIEDIGKPRKNMRAEMKAFFESFLGDASVKASDRLRAAEDLMELLRLKIPERVVLAGTGEGGAIKTENKTSVELLAAEVDKFDFTALREAMRKRAEPENANSN